MLRNPIHRELFAESWTFFTRLTRFVSRPLFWVLTILGNGVMLLAAVLLYHMELGVNPKIHTFLDALWWSAATVTTVGYGDVIPVTPQGKILGIILMVIGTAVFVSFTAAFAGALLYEELGEVESEMRKMEASLERLDRGIEMEESDRQKLVARLESMLGKWKDQGK